MTQLNWQQPQLPFPAQANAQPVVPSQAPPQLNTQPQFQQPQTPSTAPPQPSPFDVNAWAQAQGVDVSQFGGPEGFLSTLMQGVDHATTLQQQLDAMRQSAQASQPADATPDWRQYQQFLTQGDDGQIVPKPGAEYTVPFGALKAANDEQSRRKTTMESLLENPQEFIQKNLGDYVKEQAQQLFEQQREEQQRDQTIQAYLTDNARALYQLDQNGQPTDQPSPRGQRLMEIAQQLSSQGIPEAQVFPLATQTLEGELYREHHESRQQFETMQAQLQQLQQNPQVQQRYADYQQQAYADYQLRAQQQAGFNPAAQPQNRFNSTQPWPPQTQPAGAQSSNSGYQPGTQQSLPWQNPQPGAQPVAAQPNNGHQPPQTSFLADKGLSPQGAAGAWNTQERQEAVDVDSDVVRDPEDILQSEMRQRGAGGELN